MDCVIAVDIRGMIYFIQFDKPNNGKVVCWFEGLIQNATKFKNHDEAVDAMTTIQTNFPMCVSKGEEYRKIFKHQ